VAEVAAADDPPSLLLRGLLESRARVQTWPPGEPACLVGVAPHQMPALRARRPGGGIPGGGVCAAGERHHHDEGDDGRHTADENARAA